MENKKTILAVVAVLGALAILCYTQFGGGIKMSMKPYESLGFVVAEETAKLLNNQGTVLVVTETTEGTKSPNAEAQIKGFKAGLAKTRAVTLKNTQEFKRPEAEQSQSWPKGQAGRFVNTGDGAGAIVLFVTLPQELSKDDIAALKASKSKLVLVTAQSPLLKSLLEQGAIHVGIVNRFPPKPAPGGNETPRQWFDRVYIVVKPDAMGELR